MRQPSSVVPSISALTQVIDTMDAEILLACAGTDGETIEQGVITQKQDFALLMSNHDIIIIDKVIVPNKNLPLMV